MFNKSYESAVNYISELAPDLVTQAGKYFQWSEDIVNLLAFIYNEDSDNVMQYLTDAVKEYQGWEDTDEPERDMDDLP